MYNILLANIFDSSIAFTIGNITVRWYGIFVTCGIVLAYFLYLFLSHKRGIDLDFSLEAFIWVLLCAVICCRLFYVLPREEYYPIDSWETFVRFWDITKGGLTIVGGIFGGALGLLFCCLRNGKYSYAKIADCVVLCVLVGQIVGRWGNYANQELYGQVVTNPAFQKWPFAVFIDRTGQWHQALYIYEGVLNLIGLVIGLVLFFKCKKLRNFTISVYYIFWYGVVRGTLEFFKIEHVTFPGTEIGVIQVICYCAALVAVAYSLENLSPSVRWAATYAVPFLIVFSGILLMILSLTTKRAGQYVLYLIIVVLLGSVPLIYNLVVGGEVLWPTIMCAVCSGALLIFALLYGFLAGNGVLKEEIKRKFHL